MYFSNSRAMDLNHHNLTFIQKLLLWFCSLVARSACAAGSVFLASELLVLLVLALNLCFNKIAGPVMASSLKTEGDDCT